MTSVSQSIVECPGNTINGVGHTYGNNCPYDAPKEVVFDEKLWKFVGWNVTIQVNYSLAVHVIFNSSQYLMQVACFQGLHNTGISNLKNRWSTAPIRLWLNTSDVVDGQTWYDIDGDVTKRFGKYFKGLMSRLPETDFVNAIMPTINRTWVHPNLRSGVTMDSNYCEHVLDNFWLLGAGNVNLIGSSAENLFKDTIYDTSRFSEIYTESEQGVNNASRIKTVMNIDGGDDGRVPGQFLRSAGTQGYNLVGFIWDKGSVSNYNTNARAGITPACTIG